MENRSWKRENGKGKEEQQAKDVVKKNLQNRFDIYLKLWDTCCVEETP